VTFTAVAFPNVVSASEGLDHGMSLVQVKASGFVATADSEVSAQSMNLRLKEAPPPLMILQRGCTGSSDIMRMARDMLPKFGVDLYDTDVKELVRPSKNPWYSEGDDIGDAMEKGVNEAQKQGRALLFDNFHIKDNEQYRKMNEVMIRAKTRSVIIHRSNALDTLVCDVRDCFEDPSGVERGYTVDAQGRKIDLCFDRRTSPIETLAHLEPKNLVHHLAEAASFPEEQASMLNKLGYAPAKTVMVEDLYAFEYSQSNFERSVAAWETLYESLGVKADSQIIRNYLAPDVASRSRPKRHSEVIENYKVIHHTLVDQAKELCWMIRRE